MTDPDTATVMTASILCADGTRPDTEKDTAIFYFDYFIFF